MLLINNTLDLKSVMIWDISKGSHTRVDRYCHGVRGCTHVCGQWDRLQPWGGPAHARRGLSKQYFEGSTRRDERGVRFGQAPIVTGHG